MAQVVDTWSGSLDAGDPADGAVVDTALDALRAGVNSIDGTQIAASAGLPVAALDIGVVRHNGGVATGVRMLWGRKTGIILAAGISPETTITFASDAALGSVNFGAAPYVVMTAGLAGDTTKKFGVRRTTDPTTALVKFIVFQTDGTAHTDTVTVDWFAIGTT